MTKGNLDVWLGERSAIPVDALTDSLSDLHDFFAASTVYARVGENSHVHVAGSMPATVQDMAVNGYFSIIDAQNPMGMRWLVATVRRTAFMRAGAIAREPLHDWLCDIPAIRFSDLADVACKMPQACVLFCRVQSCDNHRRLTGFGLSDSEIMEGHRPIAVIDVDHPLQATAAMETLEQAGRFV